MTLADVEVRIFKKENKGYRVEIAVTGEGEPEPGYLDPAKQPPNPSDNHYADPAYGQALYNWFFADDALKKTWARVRGIHNSRRIRLRIDPDAEALHAIPWEALCEPQSGQRPALHLAASSATPFSRYLAVDVPIGTLISRRPIRILVVAPRQVDFEEKYLAKFPDMATINPQAEFRSLEQALQASIGLGRVELVPLDPPCSLVRIGQELRRGGYHGLHLVCHGLYDRRSDRAALLLADPDDRVVRVTDGAIATMLSQQLIDAGNMGGAQLRLVFLASCQSATRSSADAFRGLAPSLVKAGVPAVVAMQAQVGDETARQFATTFYEAVLDHGQVDLAANEARQDLMAQQLPGPVIPVLFLRMRNGRLFDDGKASLKDAETYLDTAIPKFELRQRELVWQDSIPKEPYKSLYSFEIKDSPIFFGRQGATDRLYDTLLKDRLTVLHARSGSGKTSLLNAGLSPRLIREGRLPAYVRGQDDPTAAIKREIAPTSLGPWPLGLDALPLQEFLGLVCRRLSRQTKELVIILDQFEEFFIFCKDQEKRQAFFHSLGQCYRDQELRVRFILSIRKDYFSELAEITKAIPTVFYNQYLLGPMTRAEATDAITGPTRLLPRRVTYEPALLDQLLDDLASGEIELPHLQIVCTELYSSLPVEASAIALDKYQALSGAAGILGNYLNTVLDRLPHAQPVLAREVLKAFVSPQSTRCMLAEPALAELVRADREQIDDVLAALVRDRLLHREDVEGEVRYELAHDILAAHISKWITAQEAQLIDIRDMLRVAVGQNKDHGYYLSQEQLDLVERYRDDLRLQKDELRLILLSATTADRSADYWFDRVVDAGMMDVELIRLLKHTLWSRYQDLSQTIRTVRSEMALDSSISSRRRLEVQLQDVSEKRSRHQRHLERLSAHQGQFLSPLIFAKDLFSELMSHSNLLTEVIGQLDTEILRQIDSSGRMRLDLIRKEAANERDRIASEIDAIESQFGGMLATLDQAPLRGLLIAKQELESWDSNALDGGGYTNLALEELKGAHEDTIGQLQDLWIDHFTASEQGPRLRIADEIIRLEARCASILVEIEQRYGRESSEFHDTLAVQLAGLQTHYSLLSVERSNLFKDLGLALDSWIKQNLKEQLRDLEAEIDSVLMEFERWYGRESSEFHEILAVQLIGLQDYYSMLSKRIMSLDTDLARALDSMTIQILNERRHDVEIERDEVVSKMLELEKQIEPNQPLGPAIERRYGRESSEFPETHAIQHAGPQDYYSTLTKRINALDTDWGRALDSLERQILKERRHDLEVERDEVVAKMLELEKQIEPNQPLGPSNVEG